VAGKRIKGRAVGLFQELEVLLAGYKKHLDVPSDPIATNDLILGEEKLGNDSMTALDEPVRGGKTVLDGADGGGTVFDEQTNGVKTVLDSTAFPEKQRTPELQWNVRERKTAPQIEAEGSLTLPDITML